MENVTDESTVNIDGNVWRVELSEPSFVDGYVSVDWSITRTEGDQLIQFTMELRRNGQQIDSFESKRTGAFVPPEPDQSGSLGGSANAGDNLSLVMLGDGAELVTLSATVPSDSGYKMVPSPVPVPTWATPYSTAQEITVPSVENWTEAAIEDFTVLNPDDNGTQTHSYRITVTAEAKFGSGEQIEREIGLVNTDTGEVGEQVSVTLEPGETKEIAGEITDSSPWQGSVMSNINLELPVRARVLNPKFGSHSVESGGVPDMWSAEPREAVAIPEPHPQASDLLGNEQALFDALAYPPSITDRERAYNFDPNDDNSNASGRADHYFVSDRTVTDKNLIDAVLAWRNDDIDDEQMAKVHGLWEIGEIDIWWYRNKGNTIGGVVEEADQQSVKVHHNRHEAAQGVRVSGPGLGMDRIVDSPGDGKFTIENAVPGGSYTLKGSSEPQTESAVSGFESAEYFLEYAASEDDSEPEPEPEPDPEPVEPSVEAACDFDGAEINVGGSVTVPVDVTTGDGDTDTEAAVRIEVAGESATETVTLGPNDSARVEATFEITEPGEYVPEVTIE